MRLPIDVAAVRDRLEAAGGGYEIVRVEVVAAREDVVIARAVRTLLGPNP